METGTGQCCVTTAVPQAEGGGRWRGSDGPMTSRDGGRMEAGWREQRDRARLKGH